MTRVADADFLRQLNGFSLATAEIIYRMPDYRNLLQSYIWQDYDQAPEFPRLKSFLDFWVRELDGPLHSVRLTHAKLMRPVDLRYVGSELTIH